MHVRKCVTAIAVALWVVSASVGVARAAATELAVTMSADPMAPGGVGAFTLTASAASTGSAEKTPVTVTATLTAGVTVGSAPTGGGWDCAATVAGSAEVSCTHDLSPASPLAPGHALPPITIAVSVPIGVSVGHVDVALALTDAGVPPVTASGSGMLPIGLSLLQIQAEFIPPGFAAPGDAVMFGYTITNTGPDPVTGLRVVGSLSGVGSCPVSSLTPGESAVCTSQYSADQHDVDAGAVTEIASAYAVGGLGVPVLSPPSSAIAPGGGVPALALRVLVTTGRFTAVGARVGFSYVVTNTGAVTLHDVALSDNRLAASAISCPASVLAPGGVITCTGEYTITTSDLRAAVLSEVAIASALDGHGTTVTSPTAAAVVAGPQLPQLGLSVSSLTQHFHTAGDPLVFVYRLRNSGSTAIGGLAISDARASRRNLKCPTDVLGPGRSMTCTGRFTVTSQDVSVGRVRDTVAAWGTEQLRGLVVTAPSVTFVVTANGRTPQPQPDPTAVQPPTPASGPSAPPPAGSLMLVVSSAAGRFERSGEAVVFHYLVINTGSITITGLAVADRGGGEAPTCPQHTLRSGATTTCTMSHVVSARDVRLGSVHAVAEATGDGLRSAVSRATVPMAAVPSLELAVTAGATDDRVAYMITNTGGTTVEHLHVIVGGAQGGDVACPAASLAPGQSLICGADRSGRAALTAFATARCVPECDVSSQVVNVAGSGIKSDRAATNTGP